MIKKVNSSCNSTMRNFSCNYSDNSIAIRLWVKSTIYLCQLPHARVWVNNIPRDTICSCVRWFLYSLHKMGSCCTTMVGRCLFGDVAYVPVYTCEHCKGVSDVVDIKPVA